jgi:hypothetical protein
MKINFFQHIIRKPSWFIVMAFIKYYRNKKISFYILILMFLNLTIFFLPPFITAYFLLSCIPRRLFNNALDLVHFSVSLQLASATTITSAPTQLCCNHFQASRFFSPCTCHWFCFSFAWETSACGFKL